MRSDLLARLNEARRARRAVIRVTDLTTGADRLVEEPHLTADNPLFDLLDARFRSGRSGLVESDAGEKLFFNVHVPPPRILAVGAVHITQALVPLAKVAGFDVTIVDPRTAFATPERFAGADLRPVWPEDLAKEGVTVDAYTAVVAVTHDPKIDDIPIMAGLTQGAFYVGALGSRKTHAKRVERLQAAGLSMEQIGRIRAPIGLDIGATSPAEIAVSVLAEIISALRGPRRKPA